MAASGFSLLPPQQLLMTSNRVRSAPFPADGVADEEGGIWVMGIQLGQVQLLVSMNATSSLVAACRPD